MKEAIWREDAEKKLKNAFAILVHIDEKGYPNPIIVEASDLLKEIPSADVVERKGTHNVVAQINIDTDEILERLKNEYEIEERKRGEWVWMNERKNQHKCSQCGEVAFAWYSELEDMVEELFDYCPNCGADMRGAE